MLARIYYVEYRLLRLRAAKSAIIALAIGKFICQIAESRCELRFTVPEKATALRIVMVRYAPMP